MTKTLALLTTAVLAAGLAAGTPAAGPPAAEPPAARAAAPGAPAAGLSAAAHLQPAAPQAARRPGAYTPPWTWPLEPPAVLVRGFSPPAKRWLAGHRGIDLAAAEGTAVLAPAGGRVAFARRVVDRAVLTIDHGGGLVSSFEPVEASLPVGAIVTKGTVLGSVGTGAHCSAKCLHWGVRLDGEYVNPLNYVADRRPSVLLPVQPAG